MQCMKKFSRKRRVSKKIISGVMVAAMTVSGIWLPGKVQTVYAEETQEISKEPETRSVNLNINGKIAGISDPTPAQSQSAKWSNGTGSYIYFGYYNSNAMKYRVLDSDTTDFSLDGTHTMLLDCNTVYDNRIFDNDTENADNGQSKPNDWKYSDMYLYLNSETGVEEPYTEYSYGYISSRFSKEEAEIITESYNTSHSSWNNYSNDDYSELTGEKIFLLDSREATHGEYGYYEGSGTSGSRAKSSSQSWGLRSSVSSSTSLAELATKKGVIEQKSVTSQTFGVSPALNIDKSTIFFTRSDKDCDHERFLSTIAEESAGTWDLTLFDGNTLFDCERVNSGSVEYGDTIDIHVNTIGDLDWAGWKCPGKSIYYNQISALIEDENGTVVSYGRISDSEKGLYNTGWDEISIPVPETLEDGSYTLKIFAEAIDDGLTKTHYASNTVDFPIEIYTKEDTGISLENYNPSAVYSGNALANPTESQLTITGASYENVDFTWYQDSVSEENKLEAAPSRAGTFSLDFDSLSDLEEYEGSEPSEMLEIP